MWRSNSDQQNGVGRGFGGGGSWNRLKEVKQSNMGNNEKNNSETMTVPQSSVGKIIGKSGTKIRELQETSSCSIKIQNDDNSSADRRVELLGSSSAITHAKQLINDLINSDNRYQNSNSFNDKGFENGRNNRYGDSNGSFNQFHNGAQSNNITQNFTANCTVDSDEDWDNDASLVNTVNQKTNSYQSNSTYVNQNRNSSNSFQSQNNGNFNQRDSNKVSNSNCKRIDVSSTEVGKIIGKGGIKIREIQQTSGAQVKILSNEADGFQTPVELTGTPEQQNSAEQMINEIVANSTSTNFIKKEDLDKQPIVSINWKDMFERQKEYDANRFIDLPEVIKNFYIESPITANRHPAEVEEIRHSNNKISVVNLHKEGLGSIPNPIATFEEAFEHYPEILREIRNAGFETPSPIQKQAWPVLLQGLDMIGIAQTGTGKTLAFLLPAYIHIEGQTLPKEDREGPTVLVLSPTRELAQQIEKEVRKYTYKGIRCCCVYGGGSKREQIKVIEKGVEIVVATPGRLNDLLMNKLLSVRCVSYLVLDEADRMLDLGFEPEIRKVLLDIRPDRQTIMTSATWPEEVQDLGERYTQNPMKVVVGSLNLNAVHSVKQIVEMVDDDLKKERLRDFLLYEMGPEDKVIVFCGKKVTADDVASDFGIEGIPMQCIHGGRDQQDREQAIQDIKDGEVRILIATDVASRGIDLPDLTHVFNYDFPRNTEDYVHRVGRTGRAGRTGIAITLVTRGDWRQAQKLIDILEEAEQEIPECLIEMAERFHRHLQKRRDESDRFGGGHDRGGSRGGGGRGGGGSRGGGSRGGGGGFGGGGFGGGGFGGGGGRGGGRGRGGRGRDGYDRMSRDERFQSGFE